MYEPRTRPVRKARQVNILFDRKCYTAFPQVVKLEGDELLMGFRQAPRQEIVRHTHPRSIITLVRSYDAGHSWDLDNATQLAAGGGQEWGPIYLGHGKVAALLAWHKVAPMHEGHRAGVLKPFGSEYPFDTPGTYWIWSDNLGFNWQPQHVRLLGPRGMPCAPPIRLHDGTLLCPYYAWDAGNPFMWSACYVSRDSGATWSDPITVARDAAGKLGFCEPSVIELEPGHLLAMHRVEAAPEAGGAQFHRNESLDGGKTWTQPQNTGILSGACPRLLKLSDGRVLLTFGRRFEPCAIRAMLSDDGGKTWGDTAYIVRKCLSGDQGYTSCVEQPGGRVFTATYAQNAAGVTGIVGTFWDLP